VGIFLGKNLHSGDPEVREWDVMYQSLPEGKIAFLSDFHINDESDLESFAVIRKQIVETDPDLIVFGGDYSNQSEVISHTLRRTIAKALKALAGDKPSFAVLGNHDYEQSEKLWKEALTDAGIKVLDNEVIRLSTNRSNICIRGLGDRFSGHWTLTPIPEECMGRTITVTHDPYGLLNNKGELETLGLAGHTHCGQVALPLIGPLFIPTKAPQEMHCGRFDKKHIGITSGGLGSSIIPWRWGHNTEPGWELIVIQ